MYDTTTVSGTPFTPTGTVTYYFYDTASPVYGTTTPASSQTVTLSGGTVPNSSLSPTLTEGGYAFIGVYSGDTNYASSTGAPEPLSINQSTSSVSTTIYNSNGSTPTDALGEQVYDTTTVSGTPFTPTGTVTYYFYNTASPVYGTTTPASSQTVTLSGGTVPNSSLSSALTEGGYAYIGVYSGDTNYASSTGSPEPLSINKASSSVSTAIYDSGGGSPTDKLGEKVYDTATVSGTPFAPTGTVTYYFYNTASPVYGTTTAVGSQTVTLSGGTVPNSSLSSALTEGGYAFIGVYSGDTNYASSTGSPEPLSINKSTSSVSTVIYDSTGSTPTDKLNEKVYDTATVGGTPFTPTGTVTYYFYDTATPVYGTTTPASSQTVTLSGGTVPNSSLSPTLTGGGYAFIGVYSGDTNYASSTGSPEPLSISKASSSVSTTIYDSTGCGVTDALDEKVYDTAKVTGSPITPTGTLTYYFYTTSTPTFGTTTPSSTQTVTLTGNGSVPNSATTAALSAGGYAYIGVYSGDSNYASSTGSPEPLSIGKASSSVSTAIYDATGCGVTMGVGEKVYDTATVSGSPITPTGTLTYYFYTTSTPTFGTTTPSSTQTVTLTGNGSVPNSATTAALAAGGYAYIGVYSGDTNYSGSTGAVEPLSISKATSSVSTAIYDSTGCGVTDAMNEKVYDTAKVTGSAATPTGTLTYYFYTTSTPTFGTTTPSSTQTVTLTGNGSVPNSATTAALAAGSYAYLGVYSGDGNYKPSTDAVEPLSISKASSSVSTAIYDSTGCGVTDATGEKVYDTAKVTASPITPTGTLTYYFYTTSSPTFGTTTPSTTQTVTLTGTGTVPNSATTAALSIGSYAYIGVYSGDSNYKPSTGAVEPLSVAKSSPSIVTTPNPSVVTVGTSCGPLTDSATLSGGSNPSGTITFTLYAPGSNTRVDKETVNVKNGDGTYTTPNGYTLPNNPTPGVYQWDATYSGDGNNQPASDTNNTWEQVEVVTPCCNLSNVTFSVTTPGPNPTTTVVNDLRGNTQQGDTVTANFTVPAGYYDELSLVSYTAPESTYNADDSGSQGGLYSSRSRSSSDREPIRSARSPCRIRSTRSTSSAALSSPPSV